LEKASPRPVSGANQLSFRDELLSTLPSLRAFAISLSGKRDRADDLVQETLTKAWKHQDSFTPGTNLKAWLYAILRNEFYSQMRKKGREIEDVDGNFSSQLAVHAEQPGHLDLADMRVALTKLPPDQREALLLIGASGLSYEEAAEICGVAVGTIKSRVNRARRKLGELLHIDDESDYGPDAQVDAVIRDPISPRS
jgi:RNA polymerase sigma-70 factor (ECF subfamily)